MGMDLKQALLYRALRLIQPVRSECKNTVALFKHEEGLVDGNLAGKILGAHVEDKLWTKFWQ